MKSVTSQSDTAPGSEIRTEKPVVFAKASLATVTVSRHAVKMSGQSDTIESELQGNFLLAMPGMPDQRFKHSVIYLCSHSGDGAMGLIANKRHEQLGFTDLLEELSILPEGADPRDGIVLSNSDGRIEVFEGGPVEKHRGFVLHSNDFLISSTLPVGPKIGMTTTMDILRHMSAGTGPDRAIVAMGYSGWGAGQLEQEILENGWITCPATPELLFSTPAEERYNAALKSIGIDPRFLSDQVGHA